MDASNGAAPDRDPAELAGVLREALAAVADGRTAIVNIAADP